MTKKANPDPLKNLTHLELSTLGDLLGYKHLENGLCRGFNMMWLQAVLAGEENTFFERLCLIAKYKLDFKKLKKDIDKARQRIKKKKILDEDTRKLLEIPALYEGISLYMNPHILEEFFNKTDLLQDNFDVIYPMAKSKALEKDELVMLMEKIYASDETGLTDYFIELKKVLQQTALELPILIESNAHSTVVRYDQLKDRWHFIDTNFLQTYPLDVYFQELDERGLVNRLLRSFNPSKRKELAFTTKIFSSKQQLKESYKGSTSIENDLLTFDLNHPITSKEASIHNTTGVGALYLATRFNQPKTVQSILNIEGLKLNEPGMQKKTPLGIASTGGFKEIIELLIRHPNTNLDIADEENTTPFFGICQWGYDDIAKALLETGKININTKCLFGASYLQGACISPYTTMNEPLFQLLLDHGANLTYLNNSNETALDIALRRKNKAAILTLLKFIQTKQINPYSIISSFSLNELIDQTRSDFPQFTNYLNSYAKKENRLASEIKYKLNNLANRPLLNSSKKNLGHILENYLTNAKGASLEGEVINIPLNCIPINKVKTLQTEFNNALGNDSPFLMLIEHDTLQINLSPSNSPCANINLSPQSNSLDLLDWQLEFHMLYKKLNNKDNKLDIKAKKFLRMCEELMRVNSNNGKLNPNIEVPKILERSLQNLYEEIMKLKPTWKNETWDKIQLVIESFLNWLFQTSLAISRYTIIKNSIKKTQFINHPDSFFKPKKTFSWENILELFKSSYLKQ